jgi:hypothetical protein
VLVHAVLILPVTLLGFVYLWAEHLSLAQVMRRVDVLPVSPISTLRDVAKQ